jgi:hypothetical protein
MDNRYYDFQFQTDNGQQRSFVLFWIGFSVYAIFQTFNSLDLLNLKICLTFQFFGVVLLIISGINIAVPKVSNYYLSLLFALYFSWLLLIIFRNISAIANYASIKDFLFSPYGDGGLLYFVPLAVFLPRNAIFLKKMFDAIIGLGIVYLFFNVLLIKSLLVAGDDPHSQEMFEILSALSLPCGFIICTYVYHTKIRNLFALAIIILTLLFAIIRARRGMLIFCSGILVSGYLIYFFHSKKKYFLIYFSFLFISLLGLYASSLYRISENRVFGYITEKGVDDTRTRIEWYFFDDMKTKDWIIGKGILGSYFCPNVEENQVTNFRNVIETGYLQIVLKGGLVSLVLLLLIILPAFIMGIFFSRNILAKACGAWIIIFIACLYPRDVVKFDLNYILVWISIGVCYSKSLRNMPETDIIEVFKKRKVKYSKKEKDLFNYGNT